MTDATKAQKWHIRRGFEECGFITSINENNVGEVFFRKIYNYICYKLRKGYI